MNYQKYYHQIQQNSTYLITKYVSKHGSVACNTFTYLFACKHANNFQIKSLEPVRSNLHYKHLRRLIANDNELTSMSDLTGSPFQRNRPTTLDLRGNKITMVRNLATLLQIVNKLLISLFQFDLNVLRPIIKELEDVSKTKLHPSHIKLSFSENPWSCDCDNVYEIQNFFYAYKSFLHDAEYISCDDDRVSNLLQCILGLRTNTESVGYIQRSRK